MDCSSSHALPAHALPKAQGIQAVVFFAKDLRQGTCWHSNAHDVAQRHAPWSTFKFPHFILALESGAVSSATQTLPWNAQRRPAAPYWPKAWQQDQSLHSAFNRSAAWPFQDLVASIGSTTYAQWLSRWRYGNQAVPSGRDDFWLGGPLALSPQEQVRFLACVAQSGCGAAKSTIDALELAAHQTPQRGERLFAKTGSGPIKAGDFEGPFEGWYVGYLRDAQGMGLVAFATHVRSNSYAALREYREQASRQALTALGFLAK